MKDILLAILYKYKDITSCPNCSAKIDCKIIGKYLACYKYYKDGYGCFYLTDTFSKIRITNNIILAISLRCNELILFDTINEDVLFKTNLDNIDKSKISTIYPFIDKDYLETMLLFI